MVSSTDPTHFKIHIEWAKQLQAAGMEVFRPAVFEPGSFKAGLLSKVKRSGLRIVVVLSDDTTAVASSAQRAEMTSAGWAWVVSYVVSPLRVLQGWISMRPFLPSEGRRAFAQQVSQYSNAEFNISLSSNSVDVQHCAALYNAIMLFAHAATKVLSDAGSVHNGRTIADAVRGTSVAGVLGSNVSLDENGDLLASYEVLNYIVEVDGEMRTVPVGLYNRTLQQYSAYERAVVWPGRTTEVPIDFSGVIACPY